MAASKRRRIPDQKGINPAPGLWAFPIFRPRIPKRVRKNRRRKDRKIIPSLPFSRSFLIKEGLICSTLYPFQIRRRISVAGESTAYPEPSLPQNENRGREEFISVYRLRPQISFLVPVLLSIQGA
jgi:hypothetical protein